MKSYDIFITFFIILCFFVMIFFNIMSIGFNSIKQNWPVYRCNPLIMPFSKSFGVDPIENFTYCVQTTQTSYMGYLMEPINYTTNIMSNVVGGISDDVQLVRQKIADVVGGLLNALTSVMGVFLNIGIEFQKMIIDLKDIFNKMIGVIISMVYIIDGGVQTGNSVIAGPIGDTLNTICFAPDTLVSMKIDSTVTLKKMCEIEVDDVLANGKKVIGVMKLKGNIDTNEAIYRIYSKQLGDYIYVTGSHYIYDDSKDRYCPVSEFSRAEETDILMERLACLIVEGHEIPIGEFMFWDWEDNQTNEECIPSTKN